LQIPALVIYSRDHAPSNSISPTEPVSALEDAIKDKKPTLYDIPADVLNLWKVNIDVHEDPEGFLSRLELTEDVEGVES
jgi:hypothetical protein